MPKVVQQDECLPYGGVRGVCNEVIRNQGGKGRRDLGR